MKKITIDNFGPIHHFQLDTKDFMIFTGPQASGKSTIAKLIFFFKNIGNLIIQEFDRTEFYNKDIFLIDEEIQKKFSKNYFIEILKLNFYQTFGDISHIDSNMKVVANYSHKREASITISISKKNEKSLDIQISKNIMDFIESCYKEVLRIFKENLAKSDDLLFDIFYRIEQIQKNNLFKNIRNFFSYGKEVIYIPAGRSMMTSLSTQLDYIYTTMDDWQKSNIDYCTQNYLERILKLKPTFRKSFGIQLQMQRKYNHINYSFLYSAKELIEEILQGRYQYLNGEERLQIDNKHSIKINFASSGQQEALWILNILFNALLLDKESLFIIEEPESNLFPNAQKLITEFIALAQNEGKNQVIITTHSPYILGTVNNLLFAKKIEDEIHHKEKSRFISNDKIKELDKIVSKNKRIDFQNFSAFFMEYNKPKDCTDKEFHSIKNEVIESASENINKDFDKMLELIEDYQ